MPTVLTHPAVPIAISLALGRQTVSRRLLLAGMIASALPDLDVIAFRLGVPYAAEFGHRGFSHSILFAFIVAIAGAFVFRWFASTPMRVFGFLFAALVSHGILDAFTNGGLGVAFLWPYSAERFFAPVQVIEVSPISLARFLSQKGLSVLWSELLWVWFPLIGTAVAWLAAHRLAQTLRSGETLPLKQKSGLSEKTRSERSENRF